MAANDNPYLYDQAYCQYTSARYIKSNEYEPHCKQFMENCIEQLHFGNATNGAGPSCDCQVTAEGVKCQETCTLRLSKIQCAASCGKACTNQLFSKTVFPTCIRFESKDEYGFCIAATEVIRDKVPILEFVGTVRQGQLRYNQLHAYPLRRFRNQRKMFIDQFKEGNESRFLCHSWKPNCEVQEWIVGKEVRLLVVTKKVIAAGEVLTISYPQRMSPQEDVESEFYQTNDPHPEAWKPGNPRLNLYKYGNNWKSALWVYDQPKLTKKDKKGGKPYVCRSRTCDFRYATEAELMEHWTEAHDNRGLPDCRRRSHPYDDETL